MYTLLLLVIINFYLIVRKRNTLTATEKFVISLMSIFLLFFLFYISAYFLATYFQRLAGPVFYSGFIIAMNLILPIITTEIVLAGYSRWNVNRR